MQYELHMQDTDNNGAVPLGADKKWIEHLEDIFVDMS